jgi:hypothetical protein
MWHTSPTLRMQSAKEATQKRHVVLDENEFPVPLVDWKVHCIWESMLKIM